MATIDVRVFDGLPGAVRIDVIGTPNLTCSVVRLDGAYEAQPVRNLTKLGTGGLGTVVDCEAPLGRRVQYDLLDSQGRVLATSSYITCPAPADGFSLLRSPLKPSVGWMWVEPQDETGVEWDTSSTVHRIVGSDTPTITSEVRQRRKGTFSLLARSIGEADRIVGLTRDGTILLLRHSPCAGVQTRDLLFYPLDVTERRWGRRGWRVISIEYQSSRFVPGNTDEPDLGSWTFGTLRDSAPNFQTITGRYKNFAAVALDIRKTP